jgi:hypothetical protein
VLSAIESLVRRDPAQRGLGGAAHEPPLCPGDLARSAASLADAGTAVAIVTGFWVPRADPPAPETDGPLGAVFLARACRALGIPAWIITDSFILPALNAVARAADLPTGTVLEFPLSELAANDWVVNFFSSGVGRDLSHLVAIERAGPSHTPTSLEAQSRSGPVPLEQFRADVPVEHCDQCHNMRGEIITPHTAPTHQLFDYVVQQRLAVTTIGIGDGGNEIGMGKIPWEELRRRIPGKRGGLVACRVPCDYTVVAGTSNWGAYGLAAGLLWQRGQAEQLRPWDHDDELRILRALVEEGGAVDGISRRREATVDGLPFETYIQGLEGIRRLVLG